MGSIHWLGTVCIVISIHFAVGNELFYPNYGSVGNNYGYVLAPYQNYQNFPQPQSAIPFPFVAATDRNINPQPYKSMPLQITNASKQFSFEMIHAIVKAVENYDANFVISPFSVWSLMVLVAEGASGQSFKQLKNVLHLDDLNVLRASYKDIQSILSMNTTAAELNVNQALFSNNNYPIEQTYANVLSNDYQADHLQVNFQAPNEAAKSINEYVEQRTHGKIKHLVNPTDLDQIQLLLISSIFFKGQWKFPFDKNKTVEQAFYRDDGQYISHVPMMTQENQLRYAVIRDLDASFIELPYGDDSRLSMLLVYPNSTLTSVFQRLRQFDLSKIHAEIERSGEDDDPDDVILTLPKFKIDSDLELRTVLEHLGISDIFDPVKSNLSKMSKQKLHVSHVFHKAIIDVDEVSTTAAAVTSANVSNRNIPKEYVFNHPFGFLITDRTTNTLLFAGQVRNPNVPANNKSKRFDS